ncbi:DUF2075 domain-containing protein [Streptomyces sp. S3(2020)]|nr:DUF2075 domain-containing protein [Streptomyces sp. S3(2020)]
MQRLAAYTTWLDDLLYGTPTPWTGHHSYDLALSNDPFQLQHWIEQATAAGHTARTTAEFCWSWTRTRPRGATTLPLDITIPTTHQFLGRLIPPQPSTDKPQRRPSARPELGR